MVIAQLAYRSRAVEPLSLRDTQKLLNVARQRNAREGLTGLLVYDHGWFMQWLEGPQESLDRVWRSILCDPRHQDMERLAAPMHADRLFPDWSMQLGVAQDTAAPNNALIVPPLALREVGATRGRAAALMPGLALALRLPQAAMLVELCTAPDDAAWLVLADRIAASRPSMAMLGLHLVGPVARALGDAWSDDRVDSTDLVIAQGRLQSMIRRVVGSRHPGPSAEHLALVATVPGETHLSGVSFAAVALDADGWRVQCAFPARVEELLDSLRQDNFDVLHLALSESFKREERMASLAAAIRAARRAATNPRLQVLVSGRAFAETPGLSVMVGADGDGPAQGCDAGELAAMLAYAQRRSHVPAVMAAQATLNEVVLQVQRRRFGIPEADGRGSPAA